MDQWQSYPDSAGGSRRFNGNSQMAARDYNNGSSAQSSQPQPQPPAGYKYDQYQGGLTAQQTLTSSPVTSPQLRDGNGDVAMQDAHDPYASMKYPMRPHHQHHASGSRPSNLHSPQEPSAAAQRYSPMEVMSPTSPYAPKSAGPSQFSQQPAQRQSPTRSNDYPPQSPYFNRQQGQQLPPMNQYTAALESYQAAANMPMDGRFGNDPKSPLRLQPPPAVSAKGPVPKFQKVTTLDDLRPKVNSQPPFRRANPEGGFISVIHSPLHRSALIFSVADFFIITAPPSSNCPPPGDLSYLQPEFQIRVVEKPTTSSHEA